MHSLVDIVFLDNHLLVVNKKANVPTQSSLDHRTSLHSFCKDYLKKKFNKAGNVFCEPIHRLDKDVSGLVVFARTSKALSRLNKQMREKGFSKTYLVKVEGHVSKQSATLNHFLRKKQYYTEVFESPKENTKEASLSFEKIAEEKDGTKLKVKLHTGRYHQIRAQLAKIGHPVLGDTKYGAKEKLDNHIALHHVEVSFSHPTTQEYLTFKTSV